MVLKIQPGKTSAETSPSGCFLPSSMTPTALAAVIPAANFSPQRRVGYTDGDQWEPALAADGQGHIYILFPQYGAVSGCRACAAPTISLLVSNDNGVSWEAPHSLAPSATRPV